MSQYLPPLFPRFNVAVLHIAGVVNPLGWDVSNMAPVTLAEQKAYARKHGRICVDGRNSLLTIYGDPEVNIAFRAWHDATHLRLNAPFTFAGEIRVCHAQQADIAKIYGQREAGLFAHILQIEVIEQAAEFANTSRFPVDQRAFTLARLPTHVISALGGDNAVREANGMIASVEAGA